MLAMRKKWGSIAMAGWLNAQDCRICYQGGSRTLAVATISRDRDSLRAQLAMERG
jgi:hypothetical protein